MIRINPDNLVRIELTPKEQGAILQHCQFLDNDIYERIMNSPDGVLHIFAEDCNHLKGCIQLEIERTARPDIQNILGIIFKKLSTNSITRSVGREMTVPDFDSLTDLNNCIQGIKEKRNDMPDPEMGGLSPEQVSRLLYSNWDDDSCPVKFNKNITDNDLNNSPFFHNSRLLLNTLIQMEKENTATAKGNLTRDVINAIFDKIIIPESDRKFILSYNKVINELDVRPLHYVRVVCESSGIIELKKKKFIVKKKYIELLDDKNAGKLFYLLFFGYFRKFNIGYVDRSSDFDCIQDTVPYSFYRLSKIGKKQVDINKLKKQLFLPAVLEELNSEVKFSPHIVDEITWLVESRIVKPLELFGIVECSYKEKFENYVVIDKVKKTKLFDSFMKFEL